MDGQHPGVPDRVEGGQVNGQRIRTRQIDLVCPRSVARIRYGSQGPTVGRTGWSGTAPQMEAEESPDASDQ